MKLALSLAVLTSAGCQTEQISPTIVEAPPSGAYARGIDLPTDASDILGELRAYRSLNFVARYYRDPASRWPPLTASEARRLSSLGVKIVTVWEWHSHDPSYFSYASGYNDALSAHRQAKGVGQPPGSAIYFAVDFNARGSQLYSVDQYFRGVNAGLAAAGGGLPEYKVGVYGSGAVCSAVRGARLARYAWLSGSTAWEGSAGYNDWNIRQAAQGARFANLSFSHDANEARSDYGGFQLGNYAAPPNPAEMVVTAAAAAPVAAATLVGGAVSALIPTPAPLTPASPGPPSAPVAATMAQAPSAAPVPTAPATVRIAPATSASEAEVAALAAAEPEVPVPAHFAAAPVPRTVPEAEKPHLDRQSVRQAVASGKLPHDRSATHPAKASLTSNAKVHVAAVSRSAIASSPRHPSGSGNAANKASTPQRAEDHGSHLQRKKVGSTPSSHSSHYSKVAQTGQSGETPHLHPH